MTLIKSVGWKVINAIKSNFYRLCITGLLFNFSAYFLWTVIPLKANDLGASSLELALIQAVSYGLGALFSPVAGKLTDLINPYLLFRIADLFFIGCVVLTMVLNTKVWHLYIDVCFYAVGSGLFWPVVGSTVGKEASIGKENRNSSIYSVCWSFGKSLGYLFGGLLKKALGDNALWVAIGCSGILLFIYPYCLPPEVREREKRKKEAAQHQKEPEDMHVKVGTVNKENDDKNKPNADEDIEIPLDMVNDLENQTGVQIDSVKSNNVQGHDLDEVVVADSKRIKYKWNQFQLKNKTYIYLGYILNFSVVGSASVLSNQYIKLIKKKDIRVNLPLAAPNDMYLGLFFFIFYFAQTVAMVLMSLTTIWTYKRSIFLIGQTIIMVLFIVVAASSTVWLLLVLSFLGGLVAGFAYQTSTYYSLRASEQKKGFFVGVSEGTAKLGMAFLPLIAGVMATSLDNLYLPVYIGIAIVLFCTILCELVYHVGYTINNRRQKKRITPDQHYFEMEESHTEAQKSQRDNTNKEDSPSTSQKIETPSTNQSIDPSQTSKGEENPVDTTIEMEKEQQGETNKQQNEEEEHQE
ncbi:major facilitator superfamily transporter, putative [Entamoeba histolytica HM-1:IMSS-B]|uniref:Major facilitator superfamily transporter n=6 Tax=Entamoeba histolytica TaxID=5759 RepID=C4M404_ENTH1|nr:hypothetical protein EHI_194990 [Entamoeba histolytica HM-1:IMSS]EMD42990.1 major facilitator superfamily transporter, putative [Entamoeba histolytica KU27]EMH73447.1 major facilitator superfamily transporter, putative [Entamoeba histolytica HM-1:IMSS-B]EMS15956.1 major facilitator superfamily transporter, putative [Entamoeba histolytica HM-3:IMSS]ENY61381.1 major facilitator superfamily transporter, putative [Entamoeba histolytica HM-1:IMSS-A]GAT96072.1 hypothetical protein CL6EHI_194990 [|eukprot:XP_653857.1 hypothetical protein EHI_194990 [Entamoeba histolytica HM-1:IMSS]